MILRTFCPFFVFLYVKYLCLPERRLVIGYIYKKEDCDCRYKKMLGYRKGEDGEPEIVPEEAKLVERIFDLYIAGETPLSISEMLQAENPTFDGKHFTYGKGMIEGILFNVKYCGDAILQQSVTIDPIMKKRKKNTGEALMYYVQNSHPAIVTREKFNKARRNAQEEGHSPRNLRKPQSRQPENTHGMHSRRC